MSAETVVKIELEEMESEEIKDDENSKSEEGDNCSKTDEQEEYDIEEVLQMKIKLSDGSEAFLFSRGPPSVGPNELPSLNCHLCRVGKLLLQKDRLDAHIQGRRHRSRAVRKVGDDPEKYMIPFRQFYSKTENGLMEFHINPGENIPEVTPIFEERIIKKEDFEFKLVTDPKILEELKNEPMHEYNKKMPIIGLSYAYKMKAPNAIKYYCALCRAHIGGGGFQHFFGANHQARYIVRHFPKLYEDVVAGIRNIRDSNENEQAICNIFRKLYRKIENAKGFVEIKFVDFDDFTRNSSQYVRRCKQQSTGNHYNETTITITPEEVKSLITKALNRIDFIKPDVLELKGSGSTNIENSDTSSGRKRNGRRGRRQSEPSAKRTRDEGNGRRRFVNEQPDWDRYRILLGDILDDIDDAYNKYDQSPRSHPLYESEWNRFWSRRCIELKRANINPRNYDFDSEWGPFWLDRLEGFYHREIARKKFELKRTLNLPYNARSPSPIRSRTSPQIGSNDNNKNSWYSNHQIMPNNVEDFQSKAPTEPVSVISVIRLLTALEDQLGSLGPKAIELLSRAVLFEKNNKNPNELLLDNDVSVYFATAKEKLKGQIMADLVDSNKIRAVKNAIESLTTLMNMFEKYMKENNMNNFGNQNDGRNQMGGNNNTNAFDNQSNNYRNQNVGNTLSSSNLDQFQSNNRMSASGNNFQQDRNMDSQLNFSSNTTSLMGNGNRNMDDNLQQKFGGGGGGFVSNNRNSDTNRFNNYQTNDQRYSNSGSNLFSSSFSNDNYYEDNFLPSGGRDFMVSSPNNNNQAFNTNRRY